MTPKSSDRKSENQFDNLSGYSEDPGNADSHHGANSDSEYLKKIEDRLDRLDSRDAELTEIKEMMKTLLQVHGLSAVKSSTPVISTVNETLTVTPKQRVIKPDSYSEAHRNTEIDLDTDSGISMLTAKAPPATVLNDHQVDVKLMATTILKFRPEPEETNAGVLTLFIDYVLEEMGKYNLSDSQRDQWWEYARGSLPQHVKFAYDQGRTTTEDQENIKRYLKELDAHQKQAPAYMIVRNRLTDDLYVHKIKDEVDRILDQSTVNSWDKTVDLLEDLFPTQYVIRGELVAEKINFAVNLYRRRDHRGSINNVKQAYFRIIDEAVAEQKQVVRQSYRNNDRSS